MQVFSERLDTVISVRSMIAIWPVNAARGESNFNFIPLHIVSYLLVLFIQYFFLFSTRSNMYKYRFRKLNCLNVILLLGGIKTTRRWTSRGEEMSLSI